jgi:hypothetical protein
MKLTKEYLRDFDRAYAVLKRAEITAEIEEARPKVKMPVTELFDLDIEEISMVDRPANAGARVVLMKFLPDGEDSLMRWPIPKLAEITETDDAAIRAAAKITGKQVYGNFLMFDGKPPREFLEQAIRIYLMNENRKRRMEKIHEPH